MQLVTKVAIGVGIVVIGLGTYYMAGNLGGDKSPTAEPPKAPPAAPPAETRTTTHEPVGRLADRTRSSLSNLQSTSRPSSGSPTVTARPPAATQPTGLRPSERIAVAPPPPLVATRPAVTTGPAVTGLPPGTEPLTPPIGSRMEASPPSPTLPSPQPTPAPVSIAGSAAKKANKEHIIQPGDTFSGLAVKYFGSPKYTNMIEDANPNKDPRKLRVGMKIVIPPGPEAEAGSTVAPSPSPAVLPSPSPSSVRSEPEAPKPADPSRMLSARRIIPPPEPAAAERAYTVKPGDTWETLSKRFMKTANWTPLFEHNLERVKGDRRSLRPGLVIELPEGADLTSLSPSSTTRPAAR